MSTVSQCHVLGFCFCVQVQLGSQIFDGVARLIYDSLEWRRQYRHYRDNVQLISIPTAVTVDSQPAEVNLQ